MSWRGLFHLTAIDALGQKSLDKLGVTPVLKVFPRQTQSAGNPLDKGFGF